MSFIYIASPYSHEDESIVEERFQKTEQFVASLLIAGESVYSPIVHCHELAKKYKLPKDFKFWEEYNKNMLAKASSIYILRIDGWEKSKGMIEERKFAKECGIPEEHFYV